MRRFYLLTQVEVFSSEGFLTFVLAIHRNITLPMGSGYSLVCKIVVVFYTPLLLYICVFSQTKACYGDFGLALHC
jgi:hypothetical protein